MHGSRNDNKTMQRHNPCNIAVITQKQIQNKRNLVICAATQSVYKVQKRIRILVCHVSMPVIQQTTDSLTCYVSLIKYETSLLHYLTSNPY